MSGANPGAVIENVTIRHSDGDVDTVEDEAIIYTGLELEHASGDSTDTPADGNSSDEETVQDIYDAMTDKQKTVLHFMVSEALEASNTEPTQAEHDNLKDPTSEEADQEGNEMTRNVFEQDEEGWHWPSSLA